MYVRQTDEAGDNVAPNVFSPRDLVSNMDETVPHTHYKTIEYMYISCHSNQSSYPTRTKNKISF